MDRTFGADDIEQLLHELARRLAATGATAGIRVVGGAAIALMDANRRATHDIDAALLPPGPVQAIAGQIASEQGLSEDWINDAATAYVPLVGLDDWHELFREGDVIVSLGSAQLLLAMKLRANRGVRDTDDIEFLLDLCEVTSLEDAQEIYERYQAQDVISDSAALRIKRWLSTARP